MDIGMQEHDNVLAKLLRLVVTDGLHILPAINNAKFLYRCAIYLLS